MKLMAGFNGDRSHVGNTIQMFFVSCLRNQILVVAPVKP